MGSHKECTRILGLEGYRVTSIDLKTDGGSTRLWIDIEHRGIQPLKHLSLK